MTFLTVYLEMYLVKCGCLKAGIHYTIDFFASIFNPGSLELTDFTENRIVYGGHTLYRF